MSDNHENYDSLQDVVEFQNNMYNPGHYIGTGKVPPTISAPGNAMPLAILYFLATGFFEAIGLFLFFSDIRIASSGLVDSPIVNKSITLMIMTGVSLFFLLLALGYLRKAKKYYREKRRLEKEQDDE